MIINKIIFENFGLYSGKQTFNLLSKSKDKNIILIGGTNGAGKTTFFEGIRLCLYGPQVIEKKSQKAYEEYLERKIHYNDEKDNHPNYASVEVEFQHENISSVDVFSVKRYWEKSLNNIKERFVVEKNGVPLKEVESDQWQNFINDLIPKGLSQLFFFDGEKIQNLAEDKLDSKELSNSFKSLLGIDLIERLKSDLQIYSVKQLSKLGAKELQEKILELQSKEQRTEQERELLFQKKSRIQSKIDQILGVIEREEEKLMREGGLFSKKRETLKDERIRLTSEINSIENEIRILSAELLPFAFAKKLSIKLKTQLELEEEEKQKDITHKNIELNKDSIKKKIQLLIKNKVNSDKILELLSENFKTKSDMKQVHNLSTMESAQLMNYILMSESIPDKLISLSKKLEKSLNRLNTVIKEIEFAPENEVISPHIKEINKQHSDLGALKSEQKIIEEKFNSTMLQFESIIREKNKYLAEMKTKENLSQKLSMLNKVQDLLKSYHEKLVGFRVEEFNKTFLKYYNYLANKDQVYSRINLDPKDFSVNLVKNGGKKKVVDKKDLSAGEKQIYAITVLWTLTQISKRSLPFIIDTPLGRLDTDHRTNIIKNFFPKASKQVIILSTDEEIDKEYFDELKPYIAKCYNLEYKNEETKVKEGYFW